MSLPARESKPCPMQPITFIQWRREGSHIQCHLDSELLFKNYYFSILNKREPSALHNHINDPALSKCSLLDQQRAMGSRKYYSLFSFRLTASPSHGSTSPKEKPLKARGLKKYINHIIFLLAAIVSKFCTVKQIKEKEKQKRAGRN